MYVYTYFFHNIQKYSCLAIYSNSELWSGDKCATSKIMTINNFEDKGYILVECYLILIAFNIENAHDDARAKLKSAFSKSAFAMFVHLYIHELGLNTLKYIQILS